MINKKTLEKLSLNMRIFCVSKFSIILFTVLCFTTLVHAEMIKLEGDVRDAESKQFLPGATVWIKDLNSGTVTDIDGKFSLDLPKGSYLIEIRFVGYSPYSRLVTIDKPRSLSFVILPEISQLNEINVLGKKAEDNVVSKQMSMQRLDAAAIKRMPAFMGEVDVIKSIQMLPGVSTAVEGATGFSVRGGTPDQNLVLLDMASIYNVSHLMGFFSIFNNDIVQDATLYKGDMPASVGGRLASLLEVTRITSYNVCYTKLLRW